MVAVIQLESITNFILVRACNISRQQLAPQKVKHILQLMLRVYFTENYFFGYIINIQIYQMKPKV
jgi:hypothetical protein